MACIKPCGQRVAHPTLAQAVVPRKVKKEGILFNERTIKPTCENCKAT
ncbi:hypothetical protein [Alysiella crassa]|nr:hypothetical protein [Alysiella crassa]UOP07297.1 hypothetical protein LVJ80_02330 [Alysiella crassa]